MRGKARKRSFDEWLKRSLLESPALAARVAKRLAEMRIEQDLIALRERRGLTQVQLGKLLGISQPAVAKMEAEGGNLEISTLVRAAEVLDARLEIRLTPVASGGVSRSNRGISLAMREPRGRSAAGRESDVYPAGSIPPGLIHESAARYGPAASGRFAARRKSVRAAVLRKKR
jgi:transcriptional regulator with XRE-family HTH domain